MKNNNLAELIKSKEQEYDDFIEKTLRIEEEKKDIIKQNIVKVEEVLPQILQLTASIRSLLLSEKVANETYEMLLNKIMQEHVLPDIPIKFDVLAYSHNTPSIKTEFNKIYQILDKELVKFYVFDFWNSPHITVSKDQYCSVDGNIEDEYKTEPKDLKEKIGKCISSLLKNKETALKTSKKLFRNNDSLNYYCNYSRTTINCLDKEFCFDLCYFAAQFCVDEMLQIATKIKKMLEEELKGREIELKEGIIKIKH